MTPSQERRAPSRRLLSISLLLIVVTVAVYCRTSQCEFVNVDDAGYVYANPHVTEGLAWNSIHWAFSTGYLGNWHPITWLSHMLVVQLSGPHAAAHHIANLVLHVANVVLLLAFFYRTTGNLGCSAFVAALFAVHPLHVQSVAWVSERKDVLSAFFFFLTLLAYARYTQKQSRVEQGRESKPESREPKAAGGESNVKGSTLDPRPSTLGFRLWSLDYALVPLFFVLGLMSKPMLVTLPFLLLLLDVWPLKRIELPAGAGQGPLLKKLVIEKLPLFALSGIFSLMAFLIQNRVGAVSSANLFPFDLRVMNTIFSYARYLEKTIWPVKLCFFYPYPDSIGTAVLVLALLVLVGISFLVLKQWPERPYLAIGWLWYIGMLVPVIGLVKIGSEAMADRYMYLPSIGIFVAVTWGIAAAIRNHPSWRIPAASAGLLSVAVLGVMTFYQVGFWENSEVLGRRALDVSGDTVPARICLAGAALDKGKFEEGIEHLQQATRLAPGHSKSWLNLGQAYLGAGDVKSAQAPLEMARKLNPTDPMTSSRLAQTYQMQGESRLAIGLYRESLGLETDQPIALNNLAWMLATDPDPALRNGAEAIQLAEEACRSTQYRQALFLGTLGAAYAEAGQFDRAMDAAAKALALALKNSQPRIAAKNQELLNLFTAGQAFHEPPAAGIRDGKSKQDSEEQERQF